MQTLLIWVTVDEVGSVNDYLPPDLHCGLWNPCPLFFHFYDLLSTPQNVTAWNKGRRVFVELSEHTHIVTHLSLWGQLLLTNLSLVSYSQARTLRPSKLGGAAKTSWFFFVPHLVTCTRTHTQSYVRYVSHLIWVRCYQTCSKHKPAWKLWLFSDAHDISRFWFLKGKIQKTFREALNVLMLLHKI